MTRWPDQLDFSAELAKARAAKPDAIFAFYPGAPGMQFLTQYMQAGSRAQIPLYTASVVDEMSLPRQKELALGVSARRSGATTWRTIRPTRNTSPTTRPRTQTYPSMYGAQTYDAVGLIDSAVKAVKGDLTKKDEMRKAMEKADSSRCAATSSSARTTSRSRTSICRKR